MSPKKPFFYGNINHHRHDLSLDGIFDNGHPHVDSAYWQLFPTLYQAKLLDIVDSDQFQFHICCLTSFPIRN
jgi:hypothetical protein